MITPKFYLLFPSAILYSMDLQKFPISIFNCGEKFLQIATVAIDAKASFPVSFFFKAVLNQNHQNVCS